MELSFHDLKQNFQRFENEKLIRIATEKVDGLRPEAVQALQEVIKERGLSESILKGLQLQRQGIDEKTLLTHVELVRVLPCPDCGTKASKLNGTVCGTVVSFIIMTNYGKRLKIACPTCLDKACDSATGKSAAFGWWGFPWGIIRTIQCLTFNSRMKKQNHSVGPNETLLAFVHSKIGVLEAHRNDKPRLLEIIKDIN